MKKTNKKGFTLVELLVVIAIVAILATVAIIGYTSFTQKAQQSVDQQLVDQINNLLAAEAADGTGCASIGEVKALLAANGYNDPLVPAFKGYTYGFIAAKNAFVLVKDNKVVYPEKYAQDNIDGVELYLTSENLIFTIPDGESAGNYINSGAIKNGYIELTEGTYEGLKYGFNIGEAEENGTHNDANGDPKPHYIMTNTIGELTIGGDGAVLNGFVIYSGPSVIYDPEGTYYVTQRHEIETLKFENVTFTGSFNSGHTNVSIKNLVFENVTFDMAGLSIQSAMYIYGGPVENITFKNCKFINCENVTTPLLINTEQGAPSTMIIDGCEFEGSIDNVIQVANVGTISITNNTIKNASGRAIRVTATTKATITGNTIINSADEDGQVMKVVKGSASTELVIEDNTSNGNAIAMTWDGLTGIGK